MTDRPRSCYRADGTPKIQYDDRSTARKAGRLSQHSMGYAMAPYKCPTCGWYHLGSRKSA